MTSYTIQISRQVNNAAVKQGDRSETKTTQNKICYNM